MPRMVDLVVYGTVGTAGASVADAVTSGASGSALTACVASIAGAVAIWLRYRYQARSDELAHDELVKNLREELVRCNTTAEFLKDRVLTVTKQCVRMRRRLEESRVECVAGRCPFPYDGKSRCHGQAQPLLPGDAPGDEEPSQDAI